MRLILLTALYAALSSSTIINVSRRDTCRTGYTLCSNADATAAQVPTLLDPALQYLFGDLIHSPLPTGFQKRVLSTRDSGSLCCISSLTCLTLSALLLPFCYDRFTTNFFLPDGSYGTVSSGAFSSSSGAIANLITGDFTLPNGSMGNIYAANPAAAPNLATLALPAPFTAAGVGSAIPASILGVPITTEAQIAASSALSSPSSITEFHSSTPITSMPVEAEYPIIHHASLSKEACPAALTYTVFKVMTLTSTIPGTRTFTVLFHTSTRLSSSAQSTVSAAAYCASPTEAAGNTPFFMYATPYTTSSGTYDPTDDLAPMLFSSSSQPLGSPLVDPTCTTSPHFSTNPASSPLFFKSQASVSLASAAVALAMVFTTGVAWYIS